jgi:hypothetical protein
MDANDELDDKFLPLMTDAYHDYPAFVNFSGLTIDLLATVNYLNQNNQIVAESQCSTISPAPSGAGIILEYSVTGSDTVALSLNGLSGTGTVSGTIYFYRNNIQFWAMNVTKYQPTNYVAFPVGISLDAGDLLIAQVINNDISPGVFCASLYGVL